MSSEDHKMTSVLSRDILSLHNLAVVTMLVMIFFYLFLFTSSRLALDSLLANATLESWSPPTRNTGAAPGFERAGQL